MQYFTCFYRFWAPGNLLTQPTVENPTVLLFLKPKTHGTKTSSNPPKFNFKECTISARSSPTSWRGLEPLKPLFLIRVIRCSSPTPSPKSIQKTTNTQQIRTVDVERPKLRPPELSISVYDQNFVRSQILTTIISENDFSDELLMKNGSEKIDEQKL